MGWQDRSIISGHRDRLDFAGGGFSFLHGWEKEPQPFTVSVDVASIAGGATGFADITLTGSKLAVSKFHKCIALVPAGLEAGIELLTTTIISFEVVRVLLRNTTAGAIDPAPRTYQFYAFRTRAT